MAARRFTTGTSHHVFEVIFADRPSVVVRLTTEANRPLMVAAAQLSRRLRPRGVPLPRILAEDLAAPHPYLILERLPGSDLGEVIGQLRPAALDQIAARIASAQAAAAGLRSAGRYGYAAEPEAAPHGTWSHVLEAHLARSRSRIAAAGLFSTQVVDAAAVLVAKNRHRIDAQAPTCFLHDTTTKNVIVTPAGELSGIVDVDDLCFGDPRYAAALTLASLQVSGGPVDYVDAWLQHAGLEADRIFRIYVALFLVDFMSEHGQRFIGNERSSTPPARERLLQVFARTLRDIAV